MLQSEFEERVGMRVTTKEYNHIEQVYNVCSVDKDEFCYYWSRMNKERVRLAKEKAREQAKKSALQDKCMSILEKYRDKKYYCKDAKDVFSRSAKQTIEEAGYHFDENGYDGILDVFVFIKRFISSL